MVTRRVSELDGLRGIAALMVVAYHFTNRYDDLFGHTAAPVAWFPYGYLGVEMFFVLSGFVILLSVARAPDAGRFVVSRFARLFPAYWVAVALTFVVLTISGLWPHVVVRLGDAALNLTMLQEFFGRPNVDGAYWTLRVELLFYGLILALIVLRLLRHIEWIAGALLGLCLAWWGLERASAFDGSTAARLAGAILHNVAALGHLPFFIAGMMLYRCWHDGVSIARVGIIAASIGVTAVTSGTFVAEVQGIFIAATGLAAYGILPFLRWRVFAFFGWVSYSLYLLHQYIGYVVIHRLEALGIDPTVAIIAAGIAVLALAAALSLWIEYPAMRAIRTWYRQWSQRQAHHITSLAQQPE